MRWHHCRWLHVLKDNLSVMSQGSCDIEFIELMQSRQDEEEFANEVA